MPRKTLLALCTALLVPAAAHAQQSQPPAMQQPGIIVVSQQKCRFDMTRQLHDWYRTNAAPVLNQLVRDGRLIGWGVLEHNWGDEWNDAHYFLARDIPTFMAAFDAFFQGLRQRDPQFMQALDRFCSEHKDNIYGLVMTETPMVDPRTQPMPGILVVSSQKCALGQLEAAQTWWRTNAAPVLNQLVRDGRLMGWGLLEHAWGDEWNDVSYYIARDLPTFHAAFGTFWQGIAQRDPQFMQTFQRMCSAHKDNIYSFVMTETSTMQAPPR